MSQELGASRKEKKAQRDAERRIHGKKRKLQETVDTQEQDAPVVEQEAIVVPANNQSVQKNGKVNDKPGPDVDAPATNELATSDGASKPKKRKKTASGAEDGTPQESASKTRFILFIGNLPYSATDVSLQAHFQKLMPFTLRHRTDPKTKKSKGFAFLEFENYDRMKTCLKLYHHSMFDPESKENGGSGKGNGKGGRRINVELTAGGGGKAENRKEKIKVKNTRLEEQRKRRAEAEGKEKARKERKEALAAGKGAQSDDVRQPNDVPAESEDAGAIHPSRRARVQI